MLSDVLSEAEVGRRIRQARLRAGYSSGVAFAHEVGLTQSTLSRIESGRRAVTLPEVMRIAAALGRPPESFLEAEASGEPRFRLAVGTELDAATEPAVRWLEGFAYRVKALREFTPEADVPKPDLIEADPPKSFSEAIIAADHARRALGLGSGPAPEMFELLERVGCLVVVRPLGTGPDAVYVPSPGRIALVNGSRPRVRQRFTLGHELAHHIFHGSFVTVDANIHDLGSRAEQFCNTFAAYFLMPKSGIESELHRRFTLERPKRPEHMFWLAIHFGVSVEAMCYQLQNLRLIDAGTARTWLGEDRKALAYALGLIDERQRPPVSQRWPPEFMQRLRYALQHHVLDRAQVKKQLENDTLAVEAVVN